MVEGFDIEILAPIGRVEVVDLDSFLIVQHNRSDRNFLDELRRILDFERQSAIAVGELQVTLLGNVAEHVERKLTVDFFVGLECEIEENHLAIGEFEGIFSILGEGLLLAFQHEFTAQVAAGKLQFPSGLLGFGFQITYVALQLVTTIVHIREHLVNVTFARRVRIHAEDFGENVIGHSRPRRVHALGVRQPECRDAEPLLIHVVLAFGPVKHVCLIGPRRVRILGLEVLDLQVFPPLVAPFEDKGAERVAFLALTVGLVVHLLPLVF